MTRVLAALVTMSVVAMMPLAAPASAQSAPSVTISPTSGPIGTVITATIRNCRPPGMNAEFGARLDFSFVGDTPANSEFFHPASDGTATVRIRARDKSSGSTATRAAVTVRQCTNDGEGSAPFRVVRDQPGRFGDVPPGHTHAEGIRWLVDEGITQGCSPQRFCPESPVTRGQMATFLQRALDLPDGSVAGFRDVSANDTHARGIGAVARAGITSGCGSGRFCPNEMVSRAQMATFLERALDLRPGSVAQFRDVPPNHVHARGIGAVARARITAGCTSDRYCPGQNVNRGQMATFLMRALR